MTEPARRYRIGARFFRSVLTLLALQLAAHAPEALATWTPDGVPLAPPRSDQTTPKVVPDDAGGVIVVWQDSRACTGSGDIYAQRLDASGAPLWSADGVVVCSAPGEQSFPQVVRDLSGGAVIFWEDLRTGSEHDIYAQRIDSSGHLLWSSGGVAMCTDPNEQQFGYTNNSVVSDGAGGGLVAWLDYRLGSPPQVFAQHVLATGAIAFADPNGKKVSTALAGEDNPTICSNGAGGAIIAWDDNRAASIYAQNIDPVGALKWNPAGIPVCTSAILRTYPQAVQDGLGGAIIAWVDLTDPVNSDVYAQHLNSAGALLWTLDGIPVSTAPGLQGSQLRATTDGAGGAVIAWSDRRSPGDDVYGQRLSGAGTAIWPTVNGTLICSAPGVQLLWGLAPDGTGGVIAVWEDQPSTAASNLYVQRVLGSGAIAWAPSTGVLLSGAPYGQTTPQIISDGASGAIVAWEDDRSGPVGSSVGADIYAGRVNNAGNPLWAPNGTLVAAPGHPEEYPDIVAAGAGGAIVAWEDFRDCDLDIYAQDVDASGGISWAVDGVPICTAPGTQQTPKMCSDGVGGAIVVWSDERFGQFDIFAQRINSAGAPLWTANGVPICGDLSPQITPVITACATGGALIAWEDQRGGAHNIYLQRITATGAIQAGWPVDGLSVTSATNSTTQTSPQVISDGACGAIVTWQDSRAGNYDIYAQRVDEFGARRWLPDGTPLCSAINDQTDPRLVTDRFGGAIVTWQDSRAGNIDIAARRIDSSGTPLWSVDGVPICSEVHTQFQPRITPDGASGAIITWRDSRGGGNDVYAQRVNATGFPQWTADGIVICDAPQAQQDPEITSDGAGGAVIAWRDGRSGNDDIYAQRIDASGGAFCVPCGVALTSAAGTQFQDVIASDGTGGAIVAWSDFRSTRATDEEIYAMRMAPGCGTFATGVLVDAAPATNGLSQNRPNPFNPSTTISYNLSARGHVVIRLFDVSGRCVRILVDDVLGSGPHQVRWDGLVDSGGHAVSGTYFYRVQYPDGTVSSKKMLLLR